MAVTVKDVAKLAGVSTATVSRVINDEKGIRPETREKVLTAVKESGYRVNVIARSLKTSRSGTIGLITPEIANDFFMSIARGIESYLENFGYTLIISNSNESVEGEIRRAELLAEKYVDGVIVIPSTEKGRHFSILDDAGIPVVFADRITDDYSTDTVLVDNYKGVYEAITHLINEGHRRIAFIGGSPNLSNARERLDGYLHALSDCGIERDDDIILTGNFHVDSGYRLMERLMKLKEPPDRVFIANYFMHAGAVKYLISNGFKPENSPGLGSFDDMELSSILGYASVTVAQPVHEIGIRAAEILMRRIGEKHSGGNLSGGYEVVRLPAELRISP